MRAETLGAISSKSTRLEREFDVEAVRRMKASKARDMIVGGAELAGHAIRAGLVDEYELFLNPVIVGGGKRALPTDAHVKLELMAEKRFGSGAVYLRYRASSHSA
jgi:dihydrofolate reductase